MIPVTSFSLLIWRQGEARHSEAGPPQRGRPATARQADDVPVATERGTGDASIYHSLSHFLTFTGSIADIHSRKFTIPIS
jgi:hypothetical protein